MQTLDVGESVTEVTDWYDDDQQPAEPSAITITLTAPDGTTQTFNKGALTGESSPDSAVLDRWPFSFVGSQEGAWRFDVEGVVGGAVVKLPSGIELFASGLRTGPCAPWCTWDDVASCGPALGTLNPAQREAILDVATEVLWDLNGRVYSGVCTTTRSLCLACVSCYPQVCACEPWNGFDLGIRSPVLGVWDVVVDGATVDPSEYTVINRRYLTRVDGMPWPHTWNLADLDAFRASWAFGHPVPAGGRRAAMIFAGELARSCLPVDCALPPGTVSVNAEGVVQAIDVSLFKDGKTGLPLVDLWLEADKLGRRKKARMFAPGAHGLRTVR